MNNIIIPVSIGELFDKVSILHIKIEKIMDPKKKSDCKNELEMLNKLFLPYFAKNKELFSNLKNVNENLWKIEDDIRLKEKRKEFDQKFIQLARSVYRVNDERSNIKGQINSFFGSDIKEVKSYEDYL